MGKTFFTPPSLSFASYRARSCVRRSPVLCKLSKSSKLTPLHSARFSRLAQAMKMVVGAMLREWSSPAPTPTSSRLTSFTVSRDDAMRPTTPNCPPPRLLGASAGKSPFPPVATRGTTYRLPSPRSPPQRGSYGRPVGKGGHQCSTTLPGPPTRAAGKFLRLSPRWQNFGGTARRLRGGRAQFPLSLGRSSAPRRQRELTQWAPRRCGSDGPLPPPPADKDRESQTGEHALVQSSGHARPAPSCVDRAGHFISLIENQKLLSPDARNYCATARRDRPGHFLH